MISRTSAAPMFDERTWSLAPSDRELLMYLLRSSLASATWRRTSSGVRRTDIAST
jgi:hypothetical protein